MKLLKHLFSFAATLTAFAAAALAVLALLEERKRTSYVRIYDEDAV